MNRDRGGGFCGCLILILALVGGYTLYNNFQKSSGDCKGFALWSQASSDRYNAASRRIVEMDPDTATKADLRDLAASLIANRDAERASKPPKAAVGLSQALVDFFDMLAAQTTANAAGKPSPYERSEMIAISDRILSEQESVNDKCT